MHSQKKVPANEHQSQRVNILNIMRYLKFRETLQYSWSVLHFPAKLKNVQVFCSGFSDFV